VARGVRLNPLARPGGAGADPGPLDGADGWRAPGRAWTWLAALLAAGSVLAWWWPAALLDWQPARVPAEPWRAFSAAFVHWSAPHLLGNLAGAGAVALLGHAAGAPARLALAWACAWPLTHLALLVRPELAHYGGLSGVLHAGVATAACWLVLTARGRMRAIGWAIALGLVGKLLFEAPWGPALRPGGGDAGWWALDIATAPIAHATGAAAGAIAAVTCAAGRLRSPRD
jgi:rhomboid family GlyGly-CTERM serine protease